MGSLLDWKPLRSMQLGSTGMQKKPTPTLLCRIDQNGVLRAYRGGRVSISAQQPRAGTSATPQEGSSDALTAALVKSALHHQLAGAMPA
jgi:hypothetical protein